MEQPKTVSSNPIFVIKISLDYLENLNKEIQVHTYATTVSFFKRLLSSSVGCDGKVFFISKVGRSDLVLELKCHVS
jgi:hypothetical protein